MMAMSEESFEIVHTPVATNEPAAVFQLKAIMIINYLILIIISNYVNNLISK